MLKDVTDLKRSSEREQEEGSNGDGSSQVKLNPKILSSYISLGKKMELGK